MRKIKRIGIFSLIMLLSFGLTFSNCKKDEDDDDTMLLVLMVAMDALSGNCATVSKIGTGNYMAQVAAVPKGGCIEPNTPAAALAKANSVQTSFIGVYNKHTECAGAATLATAAIASATAQDQTTSPLQELLPVYINLLVIWWWNVMPL